MKKMNTAPRISEKAAQWYRNKFSSLNAGLETVIEAFPHLAEHALADTMEAFTKAELSAIIDVFNATGLAPDFLGQHLELKVHDGCRLERLEEKWRVTSRKMMEKIKTMSLFQRAVLEIWATSYWQAGHWEKKSPEEYIDAV